jgi:agmatine/peptidylarginine deiminase
MKAIEINGNIKTYRRLPSTWEDEKGLHLNFTKVANPQDFGFYDVVTPQYDSITQQISNLHFDGSVFTYDVTDKVFSQTLEQAKETKKQEVKAMAYKLLQPTDWYGIRLAINGIALPQDITDERNEIIRKSDIAEVEIDNLTTIAEVLKYQIVLVEPVDPLI